jgi:hypothetical protein
MTKTTQPRINREARLQWVPLDKMKVNPLSQREQRQSRIDYLVAHLDLEQLGNPIVNKRDDAFWVIDGAHRIKALRQFGFSDETIQCWTYDGLTQEEEAEKFLQYNDVLTVSAMDKFTKGVTAGREIESDINRVVLALGLRVGRDRSRPGAISAVGALRKVYGRSGPATLSRSLRIIRDAYGDSGMDAPIIDGIGMLCHRYNGDLDDVVAIDKLSKIQGGVNGLSGQAEVLRRRTGRPKPQCVAAAAVEAINRTRGGRKLPDWWSA